MLLALFIDALKLATSAAPTVFDVTAFAAGSLHIANPMTVVASANVLTTAKALIARLTRFSLRLNSSWSRRRLQRRTTRSSPPVGGYDAFTVDCTAREHWRISIMLEWFNEPAKWSEDDGQIIVYADAHTDFWQITDYGYARDNAHIYGERVTTDFELKVRFKADYTEQYDQAGAAVRVDERHWLKTGVERFEGRLRFSTVITIDHSNWVIADLPEDFDTLNLSVERTGDALRVKFSVDDNDLEMASVSFLEPMRPGLRGVMCAAPEGDGFATYFSDLRLSIQRD